MVGSRRAVTDQEYRIGEKELSHHRSLDLDGVLEADRLGEVLALLLGHVDRGVGALLRGHGLALGLGNLENWVDLVTQIQQEALISAVFLFVHMVSLARTSVTIPMPTLCQPSPY